MKTRRWSARGTRTSHALELESRVFKGDDPKKIAASLKRSAERSRSPKTTPYRSALSMIAFSVKRGGRNLPARKKAALQQAELKRLYGREGP
ncbi:MAG TPA: DUF3175 domain-containing protein [Opitutaceae bacterium]|nr:DUF3175 domain-containing protein [Opitutaceae bacterium]